MNEYEQEAYELGQQHARTAASWTVDGNTKQQAIREVVAMIDAGDDVYDYLPACPNLSGEWADDPTPRRLADDIFGYDSPLTQLDGRVDALADAYEAGVMDTFLPACEAELRAAIA